jgi:hypothetical protein
MIGSQYSYDLISYGPYLVVTSQREAGARCKTKGRASSCHPAIHYGEKAIVQSTDNLLLDINIYPTV